MSGYLGGGSGSITPGLSTLREARSGNLLANPILAQIKEDAASDRYARDSLVVFDATASGAASVSCLEGGVRVLNETRGRHALNEKMDDNPAYYYSSRAQDAVGVAAVPRTAVTSARALLEATTAAAAASRTAGAAAGGARIVREVVLSPDVRTELLNAVGAGIGLAGSAAGGVVREAVDALPPFPTFTIALAN